MISGENHLSLSVTPNQAEHLQSRMDSPSEEHKLDEVESIKMCPTLPSGFSPSATAALYKDYFPTLRPTRLIPPPIWSTLRDW